MAFGTIEYYSCVMGMDVTFSFILPDNRKRASVYTEWPNKELKVLYALHGNGDNHTAWIRKSTIELLARRLDLVVIMPQAHKSYYIDNEASYDYFRFIAQELPVVVRNYFPVSSKREDTYVIGNSMGGYGALKCALTYPERFCAAASLSGGVDTYGSLRDPVWRERMGEAFVRQKEMIFNGANEKDNSIYFLLDQLETSEEGPKLKLWMCCGTEDQVTGSQNRRVFDYIKSKTWLTDICITEGPGNHDWFYWNEQLPQALRFMGFDV